MIIIPAILEGYRSLKDKTLKVSFETNEPTPEQFLGIGNCLQQFGYLAFKKEPFTNREKEVIDNLKTDFEESGKTPGQRLRGVLFRCFEQSNEGYEDFEVFYRSKMDTIINHFKSKLQ